MRSLIKHIINSMGYAASGILWMLINEKNIKIHFTVTLLVVGLGIYLGLDRIEWILILLCVGGVWATEALNTAIERIADLIIQERDERIKIIKDVAAGGVFIMVIVSIVSGLLIFIPKIF